MTHPDGQTSFFNDASIGGGPSLKDVNQYAAYLGIEVPTTDVFCEHLKDSGFIVFDLKNSNKLILDVGEVGPTYQPGHAHADTLSFELSLEGQRVFVNSGTSLYGEGTQREWQRGTSAHNTVVVNNKNSSDVWAGFRVGKRAQPQGLQVHHDKVFCSHNGYKGINHHREWRVSEHELSVVDTLTGYIKSAVAHYYLHPEITILNKNENEVQLKLKNGKILNVSFEGGFSFLIQDTQWFPEFGRSVPNKCLKVEIKNKTLTMQTKW